MTTSKPPGSRPQHLSPREALFSVLSSPLFDDFPIWAPNLPLLSKLRSLLPSDLSQAFDLVPCGRSSRISPSASVDLCQVSTFFFATYFFA